MNVSYTDTPAKSPRNARRSPTHKTTNGNGHGPRNANGPVVTSHLEDHGGEIRYIVDVQRQRIGRYTVPCTQLAISAFTSTERCSRRPDDAVKCCNTTAMQVTRMLMVALAAMFSSLLNTAPTPSRQLGRIRP